MCVCVCVCVCILPHKVGQTSELLHLLFVLSTKCCVSIWPITNHYPARYYTTSLFTPTSAKHRSRISRTRFGLQISPARYQTLHPLTSSLAEHRPFAKLANKRKFSAAYHGVGWLQNGKINYQKDDKIYFEMRRFVHGMLEVIFYNRETEFQIDVLWCYILYNDVFCNINTSNNVTH